MNADQQTLQNMLPRICNWVIIDILRKGWAFMVASVPDPWHFGVDPDPRIHASD
jgi:hypothetical protein